MTSSVNGAGAPTVRTYTQPGRDGATARRQLMPSLVGTGAGLVAGGLTASLVHSFRGSAQRATAVGLLTGLGVGVAAWGAAWGLRTLAERQPPMPSPAAVPKLPSASPLSGPAFDVVRGGQSVGRAAASWTTWEEECTGTGDDRDCRQVLKRHYASGEIRASQPVGDPSGYAALGELHRALPLTGANPYVVLDTGGRYTAWTTNDPVGGHWSGADLDTLGFSDPNVVQVITPGGRIIEPDTSRADRKGQTPEREVGSIPVPGRGWRYQPPRTEVGSYAIRDATDVDIRAYETLASHATFSEAVADVVGRPGDQAVFDVGGGAGDARYEVRESMADRQLRTDQHVTGLRTSTRSREAVALEAHGTVFSRAGDYWATVDE